MLAPHPLHPARAFSARALRHGHTRSETVSSAPSMSILIFQSTEKFSEGCIDKSAGIIFPTERNERLGSSAFIP
jgi:hypothetical protein